MSVLAILEQYRGAWNRMSWETLAAAQLMAKDLGTAADAAVLGRDVSGLAAEAAGKQLGRVFAVEHELLEPYTADAYSAALKSLLLERRPRVVLFPHTYQVRDFAPKLCTALNRVLVSDVVAYRVENSAPIMVRQFFQGKLNADVRFDGEPPFFASLQAGAFRADAMEAGDAAVEKFRPNLDPASIRIQAGEWFREAARAVDLSAADIIVSVGRGIKEAENIGIVEDLANALGAELAASRPICDNGWLPMERQVGSSGQTVAPKMYVAVGISGAIQHLVGMKGSKIIVAINKDANAPIFEVADYGIVGDLFQVVPALAAAIRQAKGQ